MQLICEAEKHHSRQVIAVNTEFISEKTTSIRWLYSNYFRLSSKPLLIPHYISSFSALHKYSAKKREETCSNWNTAYSSVVADNNIPSMFSHVEGKILQILKFKTNKRSIIFLLQTREYSHTQACKNNAYENMRHASMSLYLNIVHQASTAQN